MRKDVVLKMSLNTLLCVSYFKELDDAALVELSMRLQREGYAPRERLSVDKLNILMRGVAAKGGKIMTNHNDGSTLPHWGDDIILDANALRDRKPAAALTYVEVITLTRPDIDAVCEMFPRSKRKIHQARIYLGLKRSMVVIAEYIRDHAGDEFAAGAAPRMGRESEVARDPSDPLFSPPMTPKEANVEKRVQSIINSGGSSKGGGGDIMTIMHKQGQAITEMAASLERVNAQLLRMDMTA